MLDEIIDFFSEGWDYFVDGLSYVFTFEWVGDLMDLFSGFSLSEFSIGGLVFGVLVFGFIYLLRKQMLNPFLVHMGSMEAIFWGGLTYVGSFIGGYIVGKILFDS